MCGIAGIIPGPGAAARDLGADLRAMAAALRHRGPDDEGLHAAPGVGLAFRRLAIIDLTPAGHQPMVSDDGALVLVFNGEVYNHLELAAELRARGRRFRSRCDAEVVLQAFAEWGEACLPRFNGMFAFAIWDVRRRTLFAARDRLGVKPFVYAEHRGEWLFASEIAALRAVLPLHRPNEGKLHDYLAYGYRTNDGETFFDGVHELPPAHWLRLADGRATLARWWELPETPLKPPLPPRDRALRLRELLHDAVRLRLRSDVPVALLQSGGLDSSAIASLVDDELAAQPRPEPVTAFTAVHPGHAFDESADVDALMQRCPQLRSVRLEVAHAELAERLPAFVAAMQEPLASASSYAHWGLMQAVRSRGIKVMLNGQGADELLGGYAHYLSGYRLLDLLLRRPWRVPAEAAAMRRAMGQGLVAQAAQTAKAVLGRRAASIWRGHVSEGGATVLTRSFRHAQAGHLRELAVRWRGDNLQRHLRGQLLHYGFNQILQYEDLSSMSQSIEMRSPFVDWRLVEFAFSLPDEDRFAMGLGKRLLRDAFRERLPASIVDNPRKIGFAQPFAEWAGSAPFRRFVATLTESDGFRSCPWWNAPVLAARLADPAAAAARGFPVWRFVCAELWLRGLER